MWFQDVHSSGPLGNEGVKVTSCLPGQEVANDTAVSVHQITPRPGGAVWVAISGALWVAIRGVDSRRAEQNLVFVPSHLRNVGTATGIYAAKWSKAIDDEWVRNLAKNRKRPESDFHLRRDSMHDSCPDWEVPEEGWKLIEPCLSLPDVNDRHVLAAAIAGHADSIVTINIKHFPASVLDPLGITALHPDEFLLQQLELEPLELIRK
jgi:hypothetical protein